MFDRQGVHSNDGPRLTILKSTRICIRLQKPKRLNLSTRHLVHLVEAISRNISTHDAIKYPATRATANSSINCFIECFWGKGRFAIMLLLSRLKILS